MAGPSLSVETTGARRRGRREESASPETNPTTPPSFSRVVGSNDDLNPTPLILPRPADMAPDETLLWSLERAPAYLLPILTALLALSLHLNTLSGEFVWADRAAVVYNRDLRPEESDWSVILRHDFWGQDITAHDSHKSYRPIATLTLRLNYILHGLDPMGYHAVNVIVHAAVCALVVPLARLVLGHGREVPAVVAGLLFAAHPVHTEPVASVVGRGDVLCGFFFVAAVLLYARAAVAPDITRPWPLAAAMALGVASALSKEIGITVFGVFVAFDLISVCECFPGIASWNRHWYSYSPTPNGSPHPKALDDDEDGRSRGRGSGDVNWLYVFRPAHLLPPKRELGIRLSLSALCALAVFTFHIWLHGSHVMYRWTVLENEYAALDSKLSRALSYGHIHALYLRKLLWPFDLCYDHGYACISPVVSGSDPRNLFTLGAYATVLSVIISALVRGNRTVLLAAAIGILPFVPASHILFPVGTILGERLLYVPSIGFCILAGHLVDKSIVSCQSWALSASSRTPRRSQSRRNRQLWCALLRAHLAVVLCAVVVWSGATVLRNDEWNSELSLFESAHTVCPSSVKILNNLAMKLLDKKTSARAASLLQDAVAVHYDYDTAHFNLGLAYHLSDMKMPAIEAFERTLQLNPNQPKARCYLGHELLLLATDLESQGDSASAAALLASAEEQLERSLAEGHGAPLVYHARGSVASQRGHHEAAVTYLQHALARNAEVQATGGDKGDVIDGGSTGNMLGLSLRALGREEEALRAFEQGLALNPSMFEIWTNAAALHLDRSNFVVAKEMYDKALQLRPDSAELANNIGWAAELEGNLHSAREYYTRALQLMAPYQHPQIVQNLHNVNQKLRLN